MMDGDADREIASLVIPNTLLRGHRGHDLTD